MNDDDNNFAYIIYGPMWQFECVTCQFMGDCWDTEDEAMAEMNQHNCLKQFRQRFNQDQWDQLVACVLNEYGQEATND